MDGTSAKARVAGGHRIGVREPGGRRYERRVDGELEVGRTNTDLVLGHPSVSRRHLSLRSDHGDLTVRDLGSTNGTFVNDVRISSETILYSGDVVRAGGVELVVLDGSPQPSSPDGSATAAPLPARPAVDDLERRVTEAAEIRYRPGSAGERAVGAVSASARRARHTLSGLGSEPWGVKPQICLVDPFPDPERPGELVTSGTIVDAARNEIWMVVTPEAPPEPLERPMALVFGAGLPAGRELDVLLEGYGLYVARTPDPDPELRELALPPLDAAEGQLRAAMAQSFVHYLVERGNDAEFRQFVGTARPGQLDAAAQSVYGAPLAALEEGWRQKLAAGPPKVKVGQFVRLAASYLRPYRRREAEIFVYMVMGLGFTVVFPFASKRLFDKAIPSGQFSQVVGILALLGVAFFISLVAGLRRAYLSAYVSSAVIRQVRTQMFSRLQTLSAGWFNQHQQGDVLSRLFSDVGLFEQGLSQTLRDGLFQVLSLVVSGVVLLRLNLLLGLIVIAGAPLVAVVYRLMATEAQKRSIAVQEQTSVVLSVTAENYGAQSVVKAFGLEGRERARFGRASDRLFDRELRLQLFGGLFGLSVNMIVTALRLLILGLGAWLILHHHLTVGGLVAFLGLMGEVISPVTVLTGIGQQIQTSTGALVRVNEVLEAAPEVVDRSAARALSPLREEIRFAHVAFSYTPERQTLQDVDISIPAGSRAVFVGPTGAGKSSILQLLMRFYDPDDGAVLFDGTDLRDASVASLRAQLGVVFQETFLFDATIRENIALGKPNASEAEIEAAAKAAELHDFVATLPRGYDTLVGERGGRLSGGQRQRLAIARALLRDPTVLLLDEATSALDPRTERLIADTLDRVAAGRTTVAVTHRLTSITGYDQIFVVVEGRVVEHGRHDELVRRGGVYATLWAEQTGGVLPTEVHFDAPSALARIPIFAALDRTELEAVASVLALLHLRPGERLREGGGRLVLVRAGRGRVLAPGISGELEPFSELAQGDVFGLSALLGQESGAVLEATEALELLVLTDEAISACAARLPSVAAALTGARAAPVPAGGQRLSRVSRSVAIARPPASDVPDAPNAAMVRRLSGSLPPVAP